MGKNRAEDIINRAISYAERNVKTEGEEHCLQTMAAVLSCLFGVDVDCECTHFTVNGGHILFAGEPCIFFDEDGFISTVEDCLRHRRAAVIEDKVIDYRMPVAWLADIPLIQDKRFKKS